MKNILHIFSVPFSIKYFVGKQFLYLKQKTGNSYFVSCSDSPVLHTLSEALGFTPLPVEITRQISPLKDIKAIYSLIRIIRNNKISTVVGHSPKGALVAMCAAKIAGVKNRIYFRHGIFYETSSGLKRTLLKNIDRLSGLLATTVVCVSQDVKRISEEDKISSPEKNCLLGKGTCSGIDTENTFNPDRISPESKMKSRKDFGIPQDSFVVGFAGRLVRDKGIPELIEAWKIFSPKYPKAVLLLIGPMEERDAIPDVTKQDIQNMPSIIAPGECEEMNRAYSVMDVFILPTYREGFPTVALEASAMELPVIITKATGCTEAVQDEVTGIFTSHSPTDIAQKLERLYTDRAYAERLGKAGRVFVRENFEQTKIWDIIHTKLNY